MNKWTSTHRDFRGWKIDWNMFQEQKMTMNTDACIFRLRLSCFAILTMFSGSFTLERNSNRLKNFARLFLIADNIACWVSNQITNSEQKVPCLVHRKAKMAKNWVFIFGKLMVLVRVFEDEKAIVTRINYMISQNWQFWNFSKFIRNPIWMHENVAVKMRISGMWMKWLCSNLARVEINRRLWLFISFPVALLMRL